MNKKFQQLKTAWKRMKSYLQPIQSWILFINKRSRPEKRLRYIGYCGDRATDVIDNAVKFKLKFLN